MSMNSNMHNRRSYCIRSLRPLLSVMIAAMLAAGTAFAEGNGADSTKMRSPERPEKSLGQKILAVPSVLLTLPVYIVEGVTRGAVYLAEDSPLKRLLNFGNPLSPAYVLGGYGSNKGLTGGLGYNVFRLFTECDVFKLQTSYSTHRYQNYRLKYVGYNLFGRHGRLIVTARYRKRPHEHFYGLGPNSRRDDETNYTLEETVVSGDFQWRPKAFLTLAVRGGYTAATLFDGRDDDTESCLDGIRARFSLSPGDMAAMRYVTLGGVIEGDWRDHPGQPSRGALVRIESDLNLGVGRSEDLHFSVTRLDASGYINLFRKRILAMRLMVQSVDLDADDVTVPFYRLSTLGSRDDLRGYMGYRFIDRDMALVTLEYRYPVWRVIDAFVFLDEGRVFQDIARDMSLRSWKESYGVGLRIWNSDGVIFRTQVAFGDETTRFYLEFGSVW